MPIPREKPVATEPRHFFDGVDPQAHPEAYAALSRARCVRPVWQYFHRNSPARYCEQCAQSRSDRQHLTRGTRHQLCLPEGEEAAKYCAHCGQRITRFYTAIQCIECVTAYMDATAEEKRSLQAGMSINAEYEN